MHLIKRVSWFEMCHQTNKCHKMFSVRQGWEAFCGRSPPRVVRHQGRKTVHPSQNHTPRKARLSHPTDRKGHWTTFLLLKILLGKKTWKLDIKICWRKWSWVFDRVQVLNRKVSSTKCWYTCCYHWQECIPRQQQGITLTTVTLFGFYSFTCFL